MKIADYKRKRKNTALIVFIFVSLVSCVLGYLFWYSFGEKFLHSGSLRIESVYGDANIYIDSEAIGITPYSLSDLSSGEHVLKISKDHWFYTDWSQTINTSLSCEPIIQREIGPTSYFSSGVTILYKDEGEGISFISSPEGAAVTIDGSEVGATPLFLPDYAIGSYQIRIFKEGYENKEFEITVKPEHTTYATVDLFQIPVKEDLEIIREVALSGYPSLITKLRDDWRVDENLKSEADREYYPVTKAVFYNLSMDEQNFYNNPPSWIRGLYYYEIVYRGKIDIPWHFLIDKEGNIYRGAFGGVDVVIPETSKGELRIGYLGNPNEGLTQEAEMSFTALVQSEPYRAEYGAEVKSGVADSIELKARETKDLGVIYSNSGKAIWYDISPKKVYLKAETEESLFYVAESWESKNVIQSLPVSHVISGQEVRFDFTIAGPNKEGEHTEVFSLWSENGDALTKIPGSEFTVKVSITGGVENKVLILETGTGYLNVRDGIGLSSGVIDRVTPGKTYLYVDKKDGWYKLKLVNGVEGWVSGEYVEEVD